MSIKPYADEVSTDSDLGQKARSIISDQLSGPSSTVKEAYVLHRYVYREIEYESRHDGDETRWFRGPESVLKEGEGNCEEQCVLLASLFAATNIDYRFVDISKPSENRGHLSLQCQVGRRATDYSDEIRSLIDVTSAITDSSVVISNVQKRYQAKFLGGEWVKRRWYVCDPVMSAYLGDPSGLRTRDYITVTPTSFKWSCEKETYDPNATR